MFPPRIVAAVAINTFLAISSVVVPFVALVMMTFTPIAPLQTKLLRSRKRMLERLEAEVLFRGSGFAGL